MSRMLIFSLVGVIMFSLAAGMSWYLQYRQHQDDPLKADDDKAGKPGKDKAKDAPVDRPLVRAPLSPDADRLTSMAATLQTQQQSLKTREQQLATREKQLDLIHEEIKKEHKKLESVRKQVDAELQLVQEKLELLEKRSAEGKKDRQDALAQINEAKRMTLELNGLESKNLKQAASWYDKMDPDAAVQIIQQMVDKGNIDTAVSILAAMGNRQAASVLGALDPSLASQIMDRRRFLKMPAPETPK